MTDVRVRALALTLAAASFGACTDDTVDPPTTHERGYRVLAELPLETGGVVELGVTSTGGIVMYENVPLGTPSPLDALVDGRGATALELYLDLAGPDAEAPPELVRAHAAERVGPPRHFDLEPTNVEAHFDWNYAATCSQDGTWFDNTWQSWGWNWHWYRSTSAYEDSSPGVTTNNLQAHLCNNASANGNFTKIFRVERFDVTGNDCAPGNWHFLHTSWVAPQHRAQFRITADPVPCGYATEGQTSIGHQGSPNWRLGLIKP
jgi:hypothetical protein